MGSTSRAAGLAIGPGEVHAWSFDLEKSDELPSDLEGCLSPEEKQHSRAFRSGKDGRNYSIRQTILRCLLAHYTCQEPALIALNTNPWGKPLLANEKLYFNTSHSHERLVIALSLQDEIGVDLEQVSLPAEYLRLADRFFSPEESTGLRKLPEQDHAEAFFHIWTQKEAFIKAIGMGMSYPLTDFEVSVDPHTPGKLMHVKREDASGWNMITQIPEAGWRLAICLRTAEHPRIKWFQPSLSELGSWLMSDRNAQDVNGPARVT